MTDKSISEQVVAILAEQTGIKSADINLDTTISGDLRMDEVDFLECVLWIEEKVGVDLDDDTLDQVDTVGALVDLVRNARYPA